MTADTIKGDDIKLPKRPTPVYGYGDVVYNGAFTFTQMQQYARSAVLLNLTPRETCNHGGRIIVSADASYRQCERCGANLGPL
jgi:hypothetical protein